MIDLGKCDSLYVSSSENYAIMWGTSFIKVYDIINQRIQKYPYSNISGIIITNDDQYIICYKYFSEFLYIYSINGKLIQKKRILKDYKIFKVIQCDKENILICSKLYSKDNNNSEFIILKYNFLNGEIQRFNFNYLQNAELIYNLKRRNKQIWKFSFSDKFDRCYDKFFIWDGMFKEFNEMPKEVYNRFMKSGCSFDENYYYFSVYGNIYKIMDFISLDEFSRFSKECYLKVFNKDGDIVLNLNNKIFDSVDDICNRLYGGYFVYDCKREENVFCEVERNMIKLHYLETGDVKKIELEYDFMQSYISFEKDILIVIRVETTYSKCLIYKLSSIV